MYCPFSGTTLPLDDELHSSGLIRDGRRGWFRGRFRGRYDGGSRAEAWQRWGGALRVSRLVLHQDVRLREGRQGLFTHLSLPARALQEPPPLLRQRGQGEQCESYLFNLRWPTSAVGSSSREVLAAN